LPQVRNGTGYLKTTRTADAIAMSLWPSRGLHLNAFEIKVYRGNWLSELKNPQKAEEIAQFCDFFWVVAPKDIIKIEEVPKNWGLMIPFGTTVKIIKEAEQLKPKNIDKLFLAAILRKAQETITPDSKLREARIEGYKQGEKNTKATLKWQLEEHESLKKTVHEFEKKSGVNIRRWDCKDIGEAVRMVLSGEHLRAKESLQELLKKSERITKQIKEVLKDE
ncbi:MAG: hypothetical protein NG737_08065, partial [Omnitrophica bacterium]|nr:hypothetical protein [Candidatus Omnitrophota bacterium]